MVRRAFAIRLFLLFAVLTGSPSLLVAQPPLIGYGVSNGGNLFRFDLDQPANVTLIGNIGFVPAGIDFRPGSRELYALAIGSQLSQLYRIDIDSAVPTRVGADFTSVGTGYNLNLGPDSVYGFDFDPKSLQPDGSMRIRFASSYGYNLQLNSKTGQIQTIDRIHRFATSFSDTWVEALAYTNNIPAASGTSDLYAIDSRLIDLYLMNPVADGNLNLVGPIDDGVTSISSVQLDIFTEPNDTDPGIGGDRAFAVLSRSAQAGGLKVYDLNLANGAIANGRSVGPANFVVNFRGGFAVLPVPEPSTHVLALALLTVPLSNSRFRRGKPS
jgi:hypothetical protein